jgi:hypothetical protein
MLMIRSTPSCNAWQMAHPLLPSGVYPIRPASTTYDVYCDKVTNGGGWTLVMKIDGTSSQFNYDSPSWGDTASFNAAAPDLSDSQMKSQAYSEVGFTQILVGLREGTDLRTAVFNVGALNALTMVTSSPNFGTRAQWMTLSANAALQPNCNAFGASKTGDPGFARVRIGILGNNEGGCFGTDSYIGLGGQVETGCSSLQGTGVSAGNRACFGAVNAASTPVPDRNVPAWGYLWVR